MLQVRVVRSRRDRSRFLRFPDVLYRGDPYWVRPLKSERDLALDVHRNPFYRHAERELFLATRGGQPVGRIAAIINHAHNEFHGEQTGFFGFFETVEDAEVSAGLIEAAGRWLRNRGMRLLRGPVSPSMNAECGVLIEGFDSSPAVLMPYNFPYYAEQLERCGLEKEIDLLAYQLDRRRLLELPRHRQRVERVVAGLRKRRPSLRIRPLDKRNIRRDAAILREMFDEARRGNFGFVPSTDDEHELLIRKLKQMVDPELIYILEVDAKPAGCVVGIPDWNIALKRSARTPGLLRLPRLLLEKKHIDNLRVIAVSVAEEFRRSGILGFLVLEILDAGLRKGYRWAELSWIAEDNTVNIRTVQRTFDIKPFKRYRIYAKWIA